MEKHGREHAQLGQSVTREQDVECPGSSGLADEIEDLCGRRDYFEAERRGAMCGRIDELDDSSARRILAALARVSVEFGDYAAAASRFEHAWERQRECLWLYGNARFYQWRDVHDGRPADLPAFQAELRAETAAAPPGSQEQAVLDWTWAMIEMGPGGDDLPGMARILRVKRHLAAAGHVEPDVHVTRARLRLLWVEAQACSRRQPAIETALAELERLRTRCPEAELREAFDYYEGKLHLLNRAWPKARACFTRLLKSDPGHQAALVWDLYCQRVMWGDFQEKRDTLRSELKRLLDVRRAPRGRPAWVFDPELVMELRSELAVLDEDDDPVAAAQTYREVLAQRPRMTFAQRRLPRVLSSLGRREEALAQAETFLAEARKRSADERELRMPVPLLVDVGLVLNENEQFEAAIELFGEAIRLQPDYSHAYAARCAARRAHATATSCDRDGVLRNAAQEVRAVLDDEGLTLIGDVGLRIELGYVLLGFDEIDEALVQFRLSLASGSSTEQDQARAGLIDALRIDRQFRDAMTHVRLAGDDPGTSVLIAAGWLHAEIGDLDTAVGFHRKASEQEPRLAKAHAAHARTLRLLGRPTEAMRVLKGVDLTASTREQQAQVVNEQGWTALELGQVEEATQSFERAHELCPTLEPVQRGLIAAAGRAKPWTEVDDIVESLPEGNAARTNIVAARAFVRLHRGELRAAAELLERCYADPRAERLTTLLLLVGDKLLEAGDLVAATDLVRRLNSMSQDSADDDPRVALLRARLLMNSADLHEARGVLLRMRACWPESNQLQLALATVEYRSGEYQVARRTLEALVQASPQHVGALELLTWTLIQLHGVHHRGQLDSDELRRAAALCDEIRRREPQSVALLECSAAIAAFRGNAASARVYLEDAARHHGTSPIGARNRATVWILLGAYEEAIACFAKRDRQVGPSVPGVSLLLGRAHYELGDKEAIAHLKHAVAGDPRDPVAPVLLASALERNGQPEGALGVLDESLDRLPRPDHPRLLLARACLTSERAFDHEGRERRAVLDEAVIDVLAAQRLLRGVGKDSEPERRLLAADVQYHLGVIQRHRRQGRAARKAFEQALKLDPGHRRATRALELVPRAGWLRDPGPAHPWSLGLGLIAVVLLIGAIVLAWAQVDWNASDFRWEPVIWVVAGALFLLVIAATLPRLAGFELGGQVKLNLHAMDTQDSSTSNLRLPLPPPPSAALMAGPSGYAQLDLPSDTA